MNELLIKMNPENDTDSVPLLTLPEQLFLLLLDPQNGKLPNTFVPLFHGFVGCGIAELQLMDKVVVSKVNVMNSNVNKMVIKVIDHSKTGDQFLDYILKKLSSSSKGMMMACAILKIAEGTNRMNKVTTSIGNSLIEKGFLRETGKKSGIFKNKSKYEIIDYQAKLNVESNICKILSNPPDFADNHLRELIILLTFKQYEDVLLKPKLIDTLINRLYPQDQVINIKTNLKIIGKNFHKDYNEITNDPSLKMINLVINGIRSAMAQD